MRTTTQFDNQRLNSQALDMLNSSLGEGAPTPVTLRNKPRASINVQDDEMHNPLLTREGVRPRPHSRNADGTNKRRHSSTFSNYYLGNKQAKDLASLMTIEDRKVTDFDDQGLLELEDQVLNQQSTIDAATKAGGKTVATRAMFSFKSELQSLIGNLQDTTQE